MVLSASISASEMVCYIEAVRSLTIGTGSRQALRQRRSSFIMWMKIIPDH